MARSNSGILAGAMLAVVGYLASNNFKTFVGSLPTSNTYRRDLHSSVLLNAISKGEVQQAEKDARLYAWAARTLAAKGAPQTDMMQAKANNAAQALQALKQQFEEQESARKPGLQVASPVAAEAPAVAPPTAAVAPPLGAISKEDVQQAEKDARLYAWAARTLAAKGAPQMDMMQAKADNAALALRSLELKFEEQEAARKPTMGVSAPSTPAVAPPAAVSPAAASSTSVSSSMPSAEEVAAAKKTADLQAWAAKTLAAKGLPEAAAMQIKAAQSAQIYEELAAAREQLDSRRVLVAR